MVSNSPDRSGVIHACPESGQCGETGTVLGHCFSTDPRQTPSEPRQGSRPGWGERGLGSAEVSPSP